MYYGWYIRLRHFVPVSQQDELRNRMTPNERESSLTYLLMRCSYSILRKRNTEERGIVVSVTYFWRTFRHEEVVVNTYPLIRSLP